MFLPSPGLKKLRDGGLKIMEMPWSSASPSPTPADQGYQGLCISSFLQKEANEANLCRAGVPILYMKTLRLKGIKKCILAHMR